MTKTEYRQEVVRLSAVLIIAVIVCVLEAWGAEQSGSLPLALDAGHVFADLAGLVSSLAIAIILYRGRFSHEEEHRYYRRGALINAYLLALVVFVIWAGALYRIWHPAVVAGQMVFWVGLAGLVGNLLQRWLLSRCPCAYHRGNRLHIDSDLQTSIAVIVTGPIIVFTGWWWFDSIASLAIGAWIARQTLLLLHDAKTGEPHRH